jgi:hypothetical protein
MKTYQTRAVLADAYPPARRHYRDALTHCLELVDGFEIEVLCGRVKVEGLADVNATDPSALPTCGRCRNRMRNIEQG